ncbi:alpha-galactosidase [Arthrobacter sp. ISL-48]|uniref:glycoside hydrolase family 36 protein n=1 Tax=Arthrobacter sp. ISL-48 TaxID=2819110 RepID=UPI001BEC8D25|nr:glycoside hydrolase family 36 protein [Arthrobacter sp. ISL-48]MBT2534227.1 alpha-galactosidase [Arthrobacter sp. ISL-48]
MTLAHLSPELEDKPPTLEVAAGGEVLSWGNECLQLHFLHGDHIAPRLLTIQHAQVGPRDLEELRRSSLPVVEIALAGDGRHGTAGKRHVDGGAAQRMRLTNVQESEARGVRRLELHATDPVSGISATVHYELAAGSSVLRCWTEVQAGSSAVGVEYVSSFTLSGLGHGQDWEEQLGLWQAANPWSGEFRWRRNTIAEHGLYNVGMVEYGQVGSKNRIAATSTGAWSTAEQLPMGILEDLATGSVLAWQLEHNGAWHYELGDRYDDLYLTISGPTAAEHQWSVTLEPGETFTTAPAAVAVVPTGGINAVAAELTAYRRRIRRPHPDNVDLPVIYNDFLNCLMSDPTTEKELPLIAAASALGVEVFCIDAGWYDDENGGWWDSVGEWEPSVKRFPDGGLAALIGKIREAGMKPGLWLEPEVVGARSRLAELLPGEAFFSRGGERIKEWGRYQLDLRHPAARAHLDTMVDRLMADFDLAYLKLDYNIDIGAGTDLNGAVGAGLLDHNRAFLDWVTAVMDRHPGLTIEGCAAGGSRTDGASGAVFPVQSLTDQQDFAKTPPISAAAPLAITPEQSGVWASVEGSMGDEQLAFSLISALLSRVHLAGRIDTLGPAQLEVVRAGVEVYKQLRGGISASLPTFPLGLPGWRDNWIAQGARLGEATLAIAVHRRGGGAEQSIELPAWLGQRPAVTVAYPMWGVADAVVLPGSHGPAVLRVTLEEENSARLILIHAT